MKGVFEPSSRKADYQPEQFSAGEQIAKGCDANWRCYVPGAVP
jgi:hypothetical protein